VHFRPDIVYTFIYRLSNGPIEAVNTRIRLLTRIAFGLPQHRSPHGVSSPTTPGRLQHPNPRLRMTHTCSRRPHDFAHSEHADGGTTRSPTPVAPAPIRSRPRIGLSTSLVFARAAAKIGAVHTRFACGSVSIWARSIRRGVSRAVQPFPANCLSRNSRNSCGMLHAVQLAGSSNVRVFEHSGDDRQPCWRKLPADVQGARLGPRHLQGHRAVDRT
jgi:hypothetical protein